jgi:hypothetical protein
MELTQEQIKAIATGDEYSSEKGLRRIRLHEWPTFECTTARYTFFSCYKRRLKFGFLKARERTAGPLSEDVILVDGTRLDEPSYACHKFKIQFERKDPTTSSQCTTLKDQMNSVGAVTVTWEDEKTVVFENDDKNNKMFEVSLLPHTNGVCFRFLEPINSKNSR